MNYTSKCNKCDKEFTHPTQERADQALRMHVSRKHTRVLRPPNETKRPYHKKPKKLEVSVNYCPTCGCNLHAVAMGIALANK